MKPAVAVAPLVGYRNAFAFSTASRRWAGMPPRQYRVRAPATGASRS